jgi:transposase
LAIDVLRETDITGATQILRISWDEAWHLMERAVARGQLAKGEPICPLIGVDEDAVAKGHKYMTLVYDLQRATVEYIGDDRKEESLDGYFCRLTPAQLAGIEAVAADMWDPFARSILEHVPDAEDKIVYDRFHIMAHVGKAVDAVRKREHRVLSAVGDETLKGSKYLWLYAAENLPDRHRERFAALRAIQLQTGRAWAIKESLRALWNYRSYAWAKRHWQSWYFWATHSRLAPIIAVARLIKRHLHNVLAYFDHPITNAVAEGLNSKIQTIKKAAYGFRNPEHFKIAVYFHCGGLDLYPATHANPG